MLARLRDWARTIGRDVHALYLAARDPRVPWYAKLLAGCVAAYALSPIDLIPDFIPVLGYLDDVLLVPGLIWLALRLLPPQVVQQCRVQADEWITKYARKPKSYIGGALIVLVWCLLAYLCWRWLTQ